MSFFGRYSVSCIVVIGVFIPMGCGVGALDVRPTPASLPSSSAVVQTKVREVSVVAAPTLGQEHLSIINGYNVVGSLQNVLSQSLAQGGHLNTAGMTKVTVTLTHLRLRSPMHTGIAFGPDFIDATVEVVAPSGQVGAFNTRAESILGVPMQEVRLSRLLTGLNQRIISGLGSVQAVVAQPAPRPAQPPPVRPAPPSAAQPPPAQPAQSTPARSPENTPSACRDRVDNDGNGHVDCADQGCSPMTFCTQPAPTPSQPASSPQARTPENTPGACRDGNDNDGDGHVDCADQDCSTLTFCAH